MNIALSCPFFKLLHWEKFVYRRTNTGAINGIFTMKDIVLFKNVVHAVELIE